VTPPDALRSGGGAGSVVDPAPPWLVEPGGGAAGPDAPVGAVAVEVTVVAGEVAVAAGAVVVTGSRAVVAAAVVVGAVVGTVTAVVTGTVTVTGSVGTVVGDVTVVTGSATVTVGTGAVGTAVVTEIVPVIAPGAAEPESPATAVPDTSPRARSTSRPQSTLTCLAYLERGR
jgi:hypothetical protein